MAFMFHCFQLLFTPSLVGQDKFQLVSCLNDNKKHFTYSNIFSGTFAVISIACRDVVEQIIGSELLDGNQNIKNETVSINSTFISNFIYQTAEQLPIEEKITSIEVLTSLCLLVGIIQVNTANDF